MDESNTTEKRRKLLTIIGLVIIAIVLVASLILVFSKKSKPNNEGEYLDPLSHQTISDPKGKSPETNGKENIRPVYLGFNTLIDQGLSSDQLSGLETAFYRYSTQQLQAIKEISVDVDNITTYQDKSFANGSFVMQFKVRFDRKTDYTAKVEYSGLSVVRLYLLGANNQIIYDSQVIDAQGTEAE